MSKGAWHPVLSACDFVKQRRQWRGDRVSPPGDVLIRTNERKPRLIKVLQSHGRGTCHCEGYTQGMGMFNQGVHRIVLSTICDQQGEAFSKVVVQRTAVMQPSVWR